MWDSFGIDKEPRVLRFESTRVRPPHLSFGIDGGAPSLGFDLGRRGESGDGLHVSFGIDEEVYALPSAFVWNMRVPRCGSFVFTRLPLFILLS